MQNRATRVAGLALAVIVITSAACGAKGPTSPTVPTGPRILLAGQSNAQGLFDCCMRDAFPLVAHNSINDWLASGPFAAAGRNPDLVALVWWQGAGDITMSAAEYAAKLRQLITIARSGNPRLPIRIVELPPLGDRAHIRVAQSEVADDPGVQLILTSDLSLMQDGTGHFTLESYREVKRRIDASLAQ
jgi:hypothetical protein